MGIFIKFQRCAVRLPLFAGCHTLVMFVAGIMVGPLEIASYCSFSIHARAEKCSMFVLSKTVG